MFKTMRYTNIIYPNETWIDHDESFHLCKFCVFVYPKITFYRILDIFEEYKIDVRGRLLNTYPGKCLLSHITLTDVYSKNQESYASKSEGKDERVFLVIEDRRL